MNNGTERCEVQIGKHHGKRSAHYRTVQANASRRGVRVATSQQGTPETT